MAGKTGDMTLEKQLKKWLREWDSNPRPLAYETNELPDCSIPQ